MIDSISFENFRVLRSSTLKLSALTLLVGPNGSGKSSVLRGLLAVRHGLSAVDLSTDLPSTAPIIIEAKSVAPASATHRAVWTATGGLTRASHGEAAGYAELTNAIERFSVFTLDPDAIAKPHQQTPETKLATNGAGIPAVLGNLRDRHEERFEALNHELIRWLPEYTGIMLDMSQSGARVFELRTRRGGHRIPAGALSEGTRLAVAMLTLAYLPDLQPLVAFEEVERGLHPRLLRDLRESLYRLAYPSRFEESRQPVQVIATTHSPYLLDLFRENPEEIVIAHRLPDNVEFHRLSEMEHVADILQDTPLGEAWFSGILGGVPAGS